MLAGLCVLLPFVTASCSTAQSPSEHLQVTYTGVDLLTGGKPDVTVIVRSGRRPGGQVSRPTDAQNLASAVIGPVPPQPLVWVALVLMVAAALAAAVPARLPRATITAGLALAAAVILAGAAYLARTHIADSTTANVIALGRPSRLPPPTTAEIRGYENYQRIRDAFHYGYGVWAALTALSFVGLANGAALVGRRPRPPSAEPPPSPTPGAGPDPEDAAGAAPR